MYPVETDRMTVILNLRFPTSFSVRFENAEPRVYEAGTYRDAGLFSRPLLDGWLAACTLPGGRTPCVRLFEITPEYRVCFKKELT